jgi:hypothetical protein
MDSVEAITRIRAIERFFRGASAARAPPSTYRVVQ